MNTSSRFADWMDRVDNAVYLLSGLSVYDLTDCPFQDWYADGKTPKQAARAAIRNAKE